MVTGGPVHELQDVVCKISTTGTLHPKQRGEHAAAIGRAIIAHWTFSVQENGLLANTTLLDRYREYAEGIMNDNAEKFYEGQMQPRGHWDVWGEETPLQPR